MRRASSIGIDGWMSMPACSLMSSYMVARRQGGASSRGSPPISIWVVPMDAWAAAPTISSVRTIMSR